MWTSLVWAILLCCTCDGVQTTNSTDRWILAAPWTPFHNNGSVNIAPIAAQAKFAADMGVNFLWVSGGMAQFQTLTIEERENIADAWVKEGHKHGLFMCVHVGHLEISAAHRLATHAQKIGADAVSSVPPFYGPAPSADQLYAWFGEVLKGVTLPFYYYHIPAETHVPLNIYDFMEGAIGQGKLPTLRGVKFVEDNIPDFHKSINYGGGKGVKEVMWAPEPKLQMKPFGGKSIVLAESFFGNLEGRFLTAFDKGDMKTALQLQEYCQQIRAIIAKYPSGDKQVMRGFGIDLGPPRLPLSPLPPQMYPEMIAELKQANFFEEARKTS